MCVCRNSSTQRVISCRFRSIQAYLDNVFDVGALLEDAETKNAALERVEELEENMSHVRCFECSFLLSLVSHSCCF